MRNGIALRELEWKCVKEHMRTMNEMINLQSLKVIYKYGDITDIEVVECIVQQCNCLAVKNHGLSKAISKKYPWSDLYKQRRAVRNRNLAIPEDRGLPGTIEIMKSPQRNIPDVVCLLAQWDFGVGNKRNIEPYKDTKENRQKWFHECMMKLGESEYQKIAFPFKIGCGLAQGDWKEYLKMIKDMAKTFGKQVIIIVPK
jgi:O-acetyl-ADP-ribose deacetylase (regulator of RNase III)